MSKTVKKHKRNYNDFENDPVEGKVKKENIVNKHKEKRVQRALKTLDIDELMDEYEDEDVGEWGW